MVSQRAYNTILHSSSLCSPKSYLAELSINQNNFALTYNMSGVSVLFMRKRLSSKLKRDFHYNAIDIFSYSNY